MQPVIQASADASREILQAKGIELRHRGQLEDQILPVVLKGNVLKKSAIHEKFGVVVHLRGGEGDAPLQVCRGG